MLFPLFIASLKIGALYRTVPPICMLSVSIRKWLIVNALLLIVNLTLIEI